MNYQELNNVSDATLKGKAINDLVNSTMGGQQQVATMTVAEDITDTDTFSISGLAVAETYELHVIATDTGVNINDELASDTSVVIFTTSAAHGVANGAVLRCESEFMLVTAVGSTTELTVTRGYAGSTAATHADDSDLHEAAQAVTSGQIGIPVTAATVATMDSELVSGFNALQGNDVTAVLSGTGIVTLYRPDDGNTGTLAEGLTHASNLLDTAFRNGVEVGGNKVCLTTRVPAAVEVTNDLLTVAFPFAPTQVIIDIVATSTNAALAWDGAYSISGKAVTLDNSGSADWDADDTVRIIAFG